MIQKREKNICVPDILKSEGEKRVTDFIAKMKNPPLMDLLRGVDHEEIKTVFSLSNFISDTIKKDPDILKDLLHTGNLFQSYPENHYHKTINKKLSGIHDTETFGEELRYIRRREMIRIAWRDLMNRSPLNETLEDLSRLADTCVDLAFKYLHEKMSEIHGYPCDSQGRRIEILVIGMGKLGASELNFSSDIDLIFSYRENGHTDHPENPVESQVFFTKLCHKFLSLFHNTGPSDLLFRVDTRLRPYGESGPIIMDFDSMEEYYLRQGREWERYASIKARRIAGDEKDGIILFRKLRSFVYRRYFDFAVYDSLREMKSKIMFQVKQKGVEGNIKIGAGGIREIEFFGQIFQLIRGGIDHSLKRKKIMDVLIILDREGYVPEKVIQELKNAYIFLRLTENHIQEYQDAQTHELPKTEYARTALYVSMGFDSWQEFEHAISHHMQRVHSHFSELLSDRYNENMQDNKKEKLSALWKNNLGKDESIQILKDTGFIHPEEGLLLLQNLKEDKNTKTLSLEGIKRLDKLMPQVLEKIGACKKPSRVLGKILDLIKTIERRTCYIALLIENPAALSRIIEFAEKSAWIISFLSQHPVLLDELIDIEKIRHPPGKKEMKQELEHRLGKLEEFDPETILEEMCVFKQNITLRIAAADIGGHLPLMKVSDGLTFLAETILESVLNLSWTQMKEKYGLPSFMKEQDEVRDFTVVAFGKLGGIELGYASDLDLIFLYHGNQGVTQGKKSIDNMLFFSRLAQRVIHTLSARTGTGVLYETDMRLRPGGESGLIASRIDSFREYYQKDAWTWEHQALVRGRFVTGDLKISNRFSEIRKKILSNIRDQKILQGEVVKMREKIREHKLKKEAHLFDVKQGKGGIVDIEFLVQYLVLLNSSKNEAVSRWSDNIRIIDTLEHENLLKKRESDTLKQAYVTYRRFIHRQSLEEKNHLLDPHVFKETIKSVQTIWNRHMIPE